MFIARSGAAALPVLPGFLVKLPPRSWENRLKMEKQQLEGTLCVGFYKQDALIFFFSFIKGFGFFNQPLIPGCFAAQLGCGARPLCAADRLCQGLSMAQLLCEPSALLCGSCRAACMALLVLNTQKSDFKNTPGQLQAGMPGLTAPLNFLYLLCYELFRHLLKLEMFLSLKQGTSKCG